MSIGQIAAQGMGNLARREISTTASQAVADKIATGLAEDSVNLASRDLKAIGSMADLITATGRKLETLPVSVRSFVGLRLSHQDNLPKMQALWAEMRPQVNRLSDQVSKLDHPVKQQLQDILNETSNSFQADMSAIPKGGGYLTRMEHAQQSYRSAISNYTAAAEMIASLVK